MKTLRTISKHRSLRGLFIIMLLFCQSGLSAQEPDEYSLEIAPEESVVLPWPQNMQHALDQAIAFDEMLTYSQLGFLVYDITADSIVYDRGRLQLLRPASVQKLLTTVTALTELGGSFQFQTRMYASGEVSDSVLHGDLYMKGGFDPTFDAYDMEAFIDTLALMGIKEIDGQVYSDMSLKDTLKWGEGWCWDDDERLLRPLLYNGKDIFMKRFYERLDDSGILHPQTYTEKIVPMDSVRQLSVRVHTVDQILMPLLKNSNNLYAEALFYQLGVKDGPPYPSARVSAGKVEQLLRSIGLKPDDYNVADGSGLSLYNYVTAEEIVTLLRYAYSKEEIFEHLFPALPIAGEDGTLERRMWQTSAEGNVHAKTGTLRSVSTLAGYATAANGHQLCFCILNHGIRTHATARAFQDRLCEIMTRPYSQPME